MPKYELQVRVAEGSDEIIGYVIICVTDGREVFKFDSPSDRRDAEQTLINLNRADG